MSKYTLELRYILDNEKIYPPSPSDLALTNILNNYPLENENFLDPTRKDTKTRREALNEKIINHYYFREIGFETVPRFLFALQRRLNEKMEYYNQLYKSVGIEFNPLWNVEMHETFTHTIEDNSTTTTSGDNTSTGTNNITGDNYNVESDTPPTELTEADIKGNKYASKTNYDKNSNTNTLNSTGHTEGEIGTTGNKRETFEKLTEGSSAGLPYSDAIKQWRSIMVNIEEQIINELSDLFMNVW